MSSFDNIPKDKMPEVLKRASRIFEAEREGSDREDFLEAAQEVGVPKEYMERAAAQVLEEEALRAHRQRTMLLALGVVALVVLGGWLGWSLLTTPLPGPALYSFDQDPQSRWVLRTNPESQARVAYPEVAGQGLAAALTVTSFGLKPTDGRYFVNLSTNDVPSTMEGYRQVSFRARGQGLSVRLYLEASSTERWRSPAVAVAPSWQKHVIPLAQFDYQRRPSKAAKDWSREPFRQPGEVGEIAFKVGYYINDIKAKGEVWVDDLRFE